MASGTKILPENTGLLSLVRDDVLRLSRTQRWYLITAKLCFKMSFFPHNEEVSHFVSPPFFWGVWGG